jgi:membrane-associated phospholipid phosphatase
MKPPDPWRLLPHEFFFGLFLAVTWMRLGWAAGWLGGDAIFYFGLIAANAWAVWFCRSNGSALRWRLGLMFYPLAMNAVYFQMKTAIPEIHPERMDAWLQHVDQISIGANLSLRLQPLVHPALTEFFSFCYILFFPYLLFSMIYYFCGNVALLRKFVIGLFTIYGIGFLGYSFLPAAGPCLSMTDQFGTPLDGWWITKWNAAIVNAGCNKVDAFPSLHCAVSSFLLFFDRRHRPWRFKLYLVPAAGLWISTIYLRYHYFIDVACGFALAAFALWLAGRYPRNPDRATPWPATPAPPTDDSPTK